MLSVVLCLEGLVISHIFRFEGSLGSIFYSLKLTNKLLLPFILELLSLVSETLRTLAFVFASLESFSHLLLMLLGSLMEHDTSSRRRYFNTTHTAVVLVGVCLPWSIWCWAIRVLVVVLHYSIHF